MNWGTKIVIGMALARTAVVSAGIYMVSHDTDSLEDSNYYEDGLHYDTAYAKKENILAHHAKAEVSLSKDSLTIRFTKESNVGILTLRRPSDRSLDKNIAFQTQDDTYQISTRDLHKGIWQMQLDWKSEGIDYLQEQQVYIQ